MQTYVEPAREIPVSHEVDVVVAGGGVAGVAAAICLGRLGRRVVMIERTTVPGGLATQYNAWLNDFTHKGGFARECVTYLDAHGYLVQQRYLPFPLIPFLDDALQEAGVRPLYLSLATAPIMEDQRLAGVIVESKSGRTAIRAPMVIDATGDGDLAARAGAAFQMGRASDGCCQAISLGQYLFNYAGGVIPAEEITRLVEEASRAEGIPFALPYTHWTVRPFTAAPTVTFNGTPHVTGYDPLDAASLSDALIAARRQAGTLFHVLKDHVSGFEDIACGPFTALPGVRESRRIVCDAMITHADALTGAYPPDSLFTVAQNIDIHKCADDEPSIRLERVTPYGLPYGALLPTGLEHLLVAGRCIGGDHEAHASYRIMADCLAMGEAAGIAAHLALVQGVTPRALDAAKVRTEMQARGYA